VGCKKTATTGGKDLLSPVAYVTHWTITGCVLSPAFGWRLFASLVVVGIIKKLSRIARNCQKTVENADFMAIPGLPLEGRFTPLVVNPIWHVYFAS
jgi:hypothetical protein